MPIASPKSKIQLISLGCAKNTVDSEEMLGILAADGYGIDADSDDLDVVVINTCGFINSAKQESIDTILEACERKKRGEVGKVVVTGCLAQRYGSELVKELPDVDAFLGTGQNGTITQIVRSLSGTVGEGERGSKGERLTLNSQLLTQDQPSTINIPCKPHHRWLDTPTRLRSTAPWTAYLKISEGCDHRCTFCAIPSFRGDHVSKPRDLILREAEMLAGEGAVEINLIAQDSTQYGYDLYKKPMLPTLLRELAQVDGIRWIRLFYCYPSRVNSEIIEAIAGTPKVCQYIDMPLQHSDPEILRLMRRPGSGDSYLKLLEKFRAASPDVAIRTTFIVGFPGETEEHLNNLLQFIEEAQFDRVGVFEYSLEDGTPSADLPDRVPARIKRQRKDRLMRLQQEISRGRNRAWVGREMEVLVERTGEGENGRTGETAELMSSARGVGRTFRDGPEVDGEVYFTGAKASPGEFINVRITEAREYDLVGLRVR